MAAFSKTNLFTQHLGRGAFNLHTNALKVMLSNQAFDPAWSVKADVTEIGAGNGYSAGGTSVANNAFTGVGGVATLVGDDPSIVAAGGSIGPYRTAILYSDTAANDEIIGGWDHGSSRTLNDGEELKVDILDAGRKILQIT